MCRHSSEPCNPKIKQWRAQSSRLIHFGIDFAHMREGFDVLDSNRNKNRGNFSTKSVRSVRKREDRRKARLLRRSSNGAGDALFLAFGHLHRDI